MVKRTSRRIAGFGLVMVAAVAGCQNKQKDMAQGSYPETMDSGPAPVQFSEPAIMTPVSDPVMAAPPSGSGMYTIQRGDTLWSISTRTYGNGQRWRDIVSANPGLNPSKLRVGQTITLP